MDLITTTNENNSVAIQLLNEKIKYLQEELSNTQADKDFVWSLWRQLQCTNPDLTNAISLVLKREKEKMEKKDEKVLKILEIKDNKIEELMNIIAEKTYEISELNDKLKTYEFEIKQKTENLSYLNLNIKTFEDKVLMFEQIMRKQEENYEIDRKNFNLKINQMINEIKIYEQNELNYKNEKLFLEKKILSLENQMEQYDYKINSFNEINEKTIKEFKERNEKYERLNKKYNDILFKNNTNIEYIKQQEQIIFQLKQIQNELQKTLKSQDATTSTQFNLLQEMYSETCKKLEENVIQQNELRSNLNEKIDLIKQLENDLISKSNSRTDSGVVVHDNSNELIFKHELKQVKLQNEILKQQLLDKNSIINELKQDKAKSSLNLANRNRRRSQQPSAQSNKKKRSKSLENDEKKLDLKLNQDTNSTSTNPNLLLRKIDYYKNLYESKNKELEIIESTHKRRLDRVNYLEKQNHLLKQHLKSYVEEKPNEKLNDKMTRDGVYNELSVYKHDNKQLLQEKLRLEEEIDVLKVNYEKQNTIVNELDMELKYKIDEIKLEYELKFEEKLKIIDLLNKELDEKNEINKSLNFKHEKLIKTNNNLLEDRIKLSEICSKLTEENNRLYKKWILIKKNDSKQKLLIERLKRANNELKSKKDFKRKVNKLKRFRKINIDTETEIDLNNEEVDADEVLDDADGEFTEKDDFSNESEDDDNKTTSTDSKSEDENDDEDNDSTIKQRPSSLKERRNSMKKSYYTVKCLNLLNNIKSSKKREISSKTKDNLLLAIKTLKRKLFYMSNKVKLLYEIETKFKSLKVENTKLQNECLTISDKLKSAKLANESLSNEVISLKRRENEYKEKFEKSRKEDKEAEEETKKVLDSRIKTLSQDLNKQLALNKTLKSENEKLSDKGKVIEEKLNHSERDSTQKKQLIEFYKKKLDEYKQINEKLQPALENDDLKLQIQKLTETNEKSKIQIQSLKTRLQVIQSEKQNYENKLTENEKQYSDLNQKYEQLKKEKKNVELNLKESKTKVNELNSLVKEVEDDIENKMKYLSENNEHALETIKMKLKDAFKLIFNYELILTKLYEVLIKRNVSIREKLFQNQLILNKKQFEKEKEEFNKRKIKTLNDNLNKNDNLKQAMNLASTVLNLSVSELEDIMSTDSNNTLMQQQYDLQLQQKQIDLNKECKDFEEKLKLLYSNWIKQFEDVKRNDKIVADYNASALLELISEKLNDLIKIEKQFVLSTNAA